MKKPAGEAGFVDLYFYFTGSGEIVGQKRQGLGISHSWSFRLRIFPHLRIEMWGTRHPGHLFLFEGEGVDIGGRDVAMHQRCVGGIQPKPQAECSGKKERFFEGAEVFKAI
jgi:hypothetical protein